MSTMPSLLMSPSTSGLRPARPAPRWTVAWAGRIVEGGGVAGAASLAARQGRPGRAPRPGGSAARQGAATMDYQQTRDPLAMRRILPPRMTNGWLTENVTERRARGSGPPRAREPGFGAPLGVCPQRAIDSPPWAGSSIGPDATAGLNGSTRGSHAILIQWQEEAAMVRISPSTRSSSTGSRNSATS